MNHLLFDELTNKMINGDINKQIYSKHIFIKRLILEGIVAAKPNLESRIGEQGKS